MTPPQTIITARKQLRRSSEPIAGLVMTEVDLKPYSRHGYGDTRYYYYSQDCE